MFKKSPLDLTGRCPRCLMRTPICMCADIPTVDTRARFVILRHTLEALKPTNTARIAHLAMPNSEIVSYGDGATLDLEAVAPDGTWVLYPEGEGGPPANAPPTRVLVLDGNWPQTRKMLQRLPRLRRLPRLSLQPPRADRMRMKRQLAADGMSTLEAIAAAVSIVENADAGARLDRLYDVMTERVMRARGLIK